VIRKVPGNVARTKTRTGSYDNTSPKNPDLTEYSQSDLNKVALRLNQRPRQILAFQTPADKQQVLRRPIETIRLIRWDEKRRVFADAARAGAHYILGPFGEDSNLRRWGLKLPRGEERMGKNER
jgi:hypothetical protein